MTAIFQKAIYFTVLLSVAALILLASYFIKVDLTDYRSSHYTSNVGEITRGALVGQTFVASDNNLSGISVMFATYSGRANNQLVKFGLRTSTTAAQDLRSAEIKASRLGDNQLHNFSFTPIADSQGKQYFFYVVSPSSMAGNAVTIDIDSRDPYHQGSAYIAHATDSNMFDSNLLSRSGKPGADIAFATNYQVPFAVWTKIKLANAIRNFISTWPANISRYRLFVAIALQSFLFIGFSLVSIVAVNGHMPSAKKRLHSRTILVVLFLFAITARYLYAVELPITTDEGSYLYDAHSLLHGRLAGGDGYVKAPLVILWIALWQLIAGHTVIIGRLSSIVIGALTLFPLYLIGRKLWGRQAGLTAAAAWSLFGVTTVYNIYVHTQPLAIFFGASAVALTLFGLLINCPNNVVSKPNYRWLFMAGLLFALGVISRKSILSLGLVPLFASLIRPNFSWRDRLLSLLSIGGGFISIAALFTLFSGLVYGPEGIWEALGINSAADGINAVDPSQVEQVRAYSIRGLTPFFRESLPLILLSLLGLGISLERWVVHLITRLNSGMNLSIRFINLASKISWLVPLFIYWLAWQFFLDYEGSAFFIFGIPYLWWAMATALIVIALFTSNHSSLHQANHQRSLFGLAVPTLWFIGLVIFYSNWIKFHANYIGEFLPPLIILAGISLPALWCRLINLKKGILAKIAQITISLSFVLILFWALFISNFITYLYEHTGTFTQKAITQAAAWAKDNIPLNEPIFTGANVIPYVSGHEVSLNISHPRWYAYEFTRQNPQRLDAFLPSADRMLQAYREAKWFLLDDQTSFSYLMEYSEIEAGLAKDWQRIQGIENDSNTLTFYRRTIN